LKKRFRQILIMILSILLLTPSVPAPVQAAAYTVANVFIQKNYDNSLAPAKGVIEIDGSGLKDVLVRVHTSDGSKVLGTDLGSRTSNEDAFLKFELTGPQIQSITLSDGITVGTDKITIDENNFANINKIDPALVYANDPVSKIVVQGSHFDLSNDPLTFGKGTMGGTIIPTGSSRIEISDITGDLGTHDLIFTRQRAGVDHVTGQVTLRRVYQDVVRVVQRTTYSDLEMYPNKGVAKKTVVSFKAAGLANSSVFFLKNTTDAYYAGNMGTATEFIPDISGKNTLKTTLPDLAIGTYKVIITNPLINPPPNTDLRNLITSELLVGDFMVIAAGDAIEIQQVAPGQGPNYSENAVTISGYNFEELNIENLTGVATPDGLTLSPDKKILHIDYGQGTFLPGSVPKTVDVTRTIKVIIGKDAIFSAEGDQSFKNRDIDTLKVNTQTIPDSEIVDNAYRDVVVEVVTILTDTVSGETYEFSETAVLKNGFLFVKSLIDPVISQALPNKIQVISQGGGYAVKEDMVISITGDNFYISRYTDPNTGIDQILYPKIDLGGALFFRREGINQNQVFDREDNFITGAAVRIFKDNTLIDGTTGKETGNKILISIPADLTLTGSNVNYPTYVEITNPRKNSNTFGLPVSAMDLIEFVVLPDDNTPVISKVEPPLGSIDGSKGIQITGQNFETGIQVYLDGILAASQRQSSTSLSFDAPKRSQPGPVILMVINPTGGIDSTSFTYVLPNAAPVIKSVSPPAGSTNTLVVIDGANFCKPDPAAGDDESGIFRLIGSRVLMDNQDINVYTTDKKLQGYSSPGEKLLDISDGKAVLGSYAHSILLKDEVNNKIHTVKTNLYGEINISDGILNYGVRAEGGGLIATKADGTEYVISDDNVGADRIILTRGAEVITLTVMTPYKVDPGTGKITGHRVQVLDENRILVTIPNLGVAKLYDVTVVNPDTQTAAKSAGFRFYSTPQSLPKLDSIDPAQGSIAGGYFVRITGENFEDNHSGIKTRVFINGVEVNVADIIVSADNNYMDVKIPAYTGDLTGQGITRQSVPVVVLNPSDGGSAGKNNFFTYIVPGSNPAIDNMSKTEGSAAGDYYVMISGRDFRYYEPYEDANNNVQYDEGESFTDLNGNGIWDDLTGIGNTGNMTPDQVKVLPRVYFGEQIATIKDFGKGYIGVMVPAATAGIVDVYVLNNDYGISNKVKFNYRSSQVGISQIVPATGRKQGNQQIGIYGSNFVASTINILNTAGISTAKTMPLVNFGGLTNLADESGQIMGGAVSDLKIEGGLTVNYNANTRVLEVSLVYNSQTYTGSFPNYDGAVMYLDLQELKDADDNYFPGYELIKVWIYQDSMNLRLIIERGYSPSVSLDSSSKIAAVSPSYYTIGQVPLRVINPDGASASGNFFYTNPASAPTITNITRDLNNPVTQTVNGQSARVLNVNYKGGSTIEVIGTGFASNARISIGNIMSIAAKDIAVTDTKLTFKMPAAPLTNVGMAQNLVVVNEDGGIASSDQLATGDSIYIIFTSGESNPQVTGISPNKGPAAGGTVITVSGKDLRSSMDGYDGGIKVYLDGAPAISVTSTDLNSLYALTPAHAPGAVPVRVENPDGTMSEPSAQFTYISAPAVTGILSADNSSIKTLSFKGGETLQITGSGFMSGAKVIFAPELTASDSDTAPNQLYRVISKTVNNMTSAELEAYTLNSGTDAAEITFISSTSLKITTPSGALEKTSIIVVNPDGGCSNQYEGISYGVPAIDFPTGVVAEIIGDDKRDRFIKVHWNTVPDAAGYDVYVVVDGETYYLDNTKNTSYAYEQIKPKTSYRFIVKAIGPYGSSKASLSSNRVTTGSKAGYEKAGLLENTDMTRQGNEAVVTVGQIDRGKSINIDLTKGRLSGAKQVTINLPAGILRASSATRIEILGTDFQLQFSTKIFESNELAKYSNNDEVGIKFSISPYQGNPYIKGRTVLSQLYQVKAQLYVGSAIEEINVLSSPMYLRLNYNQSALELKRFAHISLERLDMQSKQWQLINEHYDQINESIKRTGIYGIIGTGGNLFG
jgi:hypothetical protein